MKVAIFDFDGTLFPEETVPFLFKQYGKMGYSKKRQIKVFTLLLTLLCRYKMDKNMSKELFRQKAIYILLKLFKGMDKDAIDKFFKENAGDIINLLDAEVVKELNAKKENGYKIILLSGCFEMLLKYIGDELNINTIIGTELFFDEKTSQLDYLKPLTIVTGPNKVIALEAAFDLSNFDFENSIAYGDSIYDQCVFDKVGIPVAVNPDSKLKKLAKERNYRIIQTI